ncbi:MAG: hypothetical protein Fur005_16880 [Roseiflexaceae bacterium]
MPSALWANFTAAYLRVLTGEQPLLADLQWSYQLLCMPTFASTAHLLIGAGQSTGVVGFTWCDDQSAELFQAVLQNDTVRLEQVIREQRRHCCSELAFVSLAECTAIEQRISMLDPWSLEEIDLGGRDGIALLLICQHSDRRFQVHCSNPTLPDDRRHLAIIAAILAWVHDHLHSESYRHYHAVLRSYMPGLDRA